MSPSRWDGFRSRVPAILKAPVRGALDALDAELRWRALRSAVRSLRADVARGALSSNLIASIRDAWGNQGFSADVGYLTEIANRVLSSGGPFLECGSGVSTIVAGAIATQRGSRVISLEQDLGWFKYVKRKLSKLGLSNVEIIYARLRRYDDFAWFDVETTTFPPSFTHVFCDGPAVRKSQWAEPMRTNWRAGVVPVLQQRGISFDEILLDDSVDPRCGQLRETWRALGVESRIVDTPTGGLVVARPAA